MQIFNFLIRIPEIGQIVKCLATICEMQRQGEKSNQRNVRNKTIFMVRLVWVGAKSSQVISGSGQQSLLSLTLIKLTITRQVYNLFQDVQNRFIILEGGQRVESPSDAKALQTDKHTGTGGCARCIKQGTKDSLTWLGLT